MMLDLDCGKIARLNAIAKAKGWPSRADPELVFLGPGLAEATALWRTKAADGLLPRRCDFGMREVKDFLPRMCIADIENRTKDTAQYRYRYVGSEIAERFGEVTGLRLCDFVAPDSLERTVAFFDLARLTRGPVRVVSRFMRADIDYLYGEVALLPLASDGIMPDKVMTVISFSSDADAAAKAAYRAFLGG